MSLLLPQHTRLKTQIEEVLDLDLIQQKVEHDSIDVEYYAHFVLSVMAKLCAPVRDDKIKQLAETKDIIPLYRYVVKSV